MNSTLTRRGCAPANRAVTRTARLAAVVSTWVLPRPKLLSVPAGLRFGGGAGLPVTVKLGLSDGCNESAFGDSGVGAVTRVGLRVPRAVDDLQLVDRVRTGAGVLRDREVARPGPVRRRAGGQRRAHDTEVAVAPDVQEHVRDPARGAAAGRVHGVHPNRLLQRTLVEADRRPAEGHPGGGRPDGVGGRRAEAAPGAGAHATGRAQRAAGCSPRPASRRAAGCTGRRSRRR